MGLQSFDGKFLFISKQSLVSCSDEIRWYKILFKRWKWKRKGIVSQEVEIYFFCKS